MEEVKETNEQQVSELLQIRRDKLTELQEAGRDPFRETRFDRDATSAGIKGAFEDYENKQVTIAGRIMSKRGMGKAIFCHIQDWAKPSSATFRTARDRSSSTYAKTRSAKSNLRTSGNTMSATLSVSAAMSSRPRPVRSQYTSSTSRCSRSPCVRCRRSITA